MDGSTFAETLTTELQAVSHDKHLIVWYSDEDAAEGTRFFRYVDYGYNGSVRLAGNVGYVGFGGFADLAKAKGTIDAAMDLMSQTQALIVDMRGNGGGDSDTVNYLLGYFFPKPVEVTTAIQKSGQALRTNRNFTPARLGAPRYVNKPVYVLVDRSTISGGELFAYDLQSLHRTVTIGETTAGAANGLGARPYSLGHRFSISVPDTMLRNPYTGTNWEGAGVKPDVATDAKAALLAAYRRAIASITSSYDPLGELARARKDPAGALSKSLP